MAAGTLAWTAKQYAQLVLGGLKVLSLLPGKLPAAAIDIEIEHRHCRLERRPFPATASLRRSLQRGRDAVRIGQSEQAAFDVERIAVLGNLGGPFSR